MRRLARPRHEMRGHYEVVVVGSGYGGAITAYRVAAAGHDVCLLERGRELHPGEYPDGLLGAVEQTQARLRGRHVGDPRALFDFHLDGDMNVLVGSGLGGTSLINANVAATPDERVFALVDDDGRHRWPTPLEDPGALAPYYEKARAVLQPRLPRSMPIKAHALARSADVADPMSIRAPVNVTFAAGTNAAGIEQAACTGCGDCVTGCNVGAKNTVLMNYLPLAHREGASIFAEVEVRTVLRHGDRWHVSYRALGDGSFAGSTRTVTADVVVLSAGTLGTTEILLRSEIAGLPLSDRLGDHFSGNGDVLAFAYDGKRKINGIGVGDRPSLVDEEPGPCISVMHTVNDGGKLESEVLVEDAVIPRVFARVLRPGLALSALLERRGERRRRVRWSEVLLGLFRRPYEGPSDHTQTYLVMSHDGKGGRLVLDEEHDRVRVHWPNAGTQAPYPSANQVLQGFARTLHAMFVPNPAWSKRMGRRLVTVHPLGGAVMAESGAHGVVDHAGRVFCGETEDSYRGLWVADGSVVPTPLGTNPLLTISALAERTSDALVRELQRTPAAMDLEAAAIVETTEATVGREVGG